MMALWVALVGSVGAGCRFVLDGTIRSRSSSQFPWATVLINVTGSLAFGLLSGWVLFRGGSSDVRLLLGTGFCGGYTTFSTASFETVRLAQRGNVVKAVGNGVGTAVLTLGTAGLGLWLMG